MKNLRNRFERFCYRHQNKGIPNLMLYVAIGSGIVTFLYNVGYPQILELLCFDRALILQGQVWRLLTFIFTMPMNILTALIMLYCYFSLGRAMERAMGTFRFNLFYLSGIVLMDIFAMLFGGVTLIYVDGAFHLLLEDVSILYAGSMASFLHLSLVLCFSTLYPDAQFLLLYIIPIKAWLMALFYFIYIAAMVLSIALQGLCFPQCIFPLVALGNYFLFFGKDVKNILPPSWRVRRKKPKKKASASPAAQPISFRGHDPKASYTHRCTICGKTDVSNPEMEFRYCSKCNGYFCYCQEHISNHEHIET